MKELRFYKLTNSLNTTVVGHVKQLEAPVLKKYNPKSLYNFHNLNSTQFMEENPELDVFKLFSSSKKTDFLSSQLSPSIGFFISDKIVDLLNGFKIVGSKIYKVEIFTSDEKETLTDYNFLHLIDDYNNIDYSKSLFVDFSEDKEVSIDANQGIHLPPLVEPKKFFFNSSPDIFRLPYDTSVLISSSLKEKFERDNVSGIELQPFSDVQFYTE